MNADEALSPPPDSVVIPFRHGEPDGPTAVVIGAGHAPYYMFLDGRTEAAAAALDAAPEAKA